MQTLHILLMILFISCGKNQQEQPNKLDVKRTHQLILENLKLINFEHFELENLGIHDFKFQLASNSNYYLDHQYPVKILPYLPIQIKGPFEINSNKSFTILDYPDFDPGFNLSWLHFAKNQNEPVTLNTHFTLNLIGKSLYNIKKIKFLLILNELNLQQIIITDPAQHTFQKIEISQMQIRVSDLFKINQPDFKLKLLVTDVEYYIEKVKKHDNHYTVINTSPLIMIQHKEDNELKETLKLADPEVQMDEKNQILSLFHVFSNQTKWQVLSEKNTSVLYHEQALVKFPEFLNKENNQDSQSQPFYIPLEMDLELKISAYNEMYQTYTTREFTPYDSPRQGEGRGRMKSFNGCERYRAHLAGSVEKDETINPAEILDKLEICNDRDCRAIESNAILTTEKQINLTFKNLQAGSYFFRWKHNPSQKKLTLDYISQSGHHCYLVHSPQKLIYAYKLQQLKIDYHWKNFEKQ
jgi:hypothetical protein